MHVLRLLQTGSRDSLKWAMAVTCLAGLGNATLIGLINSAAERAALGKEVGGKLLALYILAYCIYYVANRASLREANRFLQERLGMLRLRLADKIRRSELRTLERIGRGDIYAIVAQETNHLSQNFPLLVSAGQSLFLLAFCLLYIATLSPLAFIVIGAATAAGLTIFWMRREALNRSMMSVYAHEAAMLDLLTHFAEGFQEIRLNADKNDALHRRFTTVVTALEDKVVGIGGNWVVLLLFSNAFLYALLGVVVLVLPMYFQGYTDVIYKLAAAAFFCVGPVTAVTAAAPLYAKAEVGLGHVYGLEQRLDEGVIDGGEPAGPSRFRDFHAIQLEAVTFGYRDDTGAVLFAAGPWDLELARGEILFMTGGNGSGKSTALKLLSGLYAPDGGRILVDEVPVTADAVQDYRELFSCVFPDFHLFDRLYGVEGAEAERVRALIRWMELESKVDFVDGRFTTLDLSTGQRKRLAMIVSLLEDRPILFFDEWAADQDSHFREVFYNEILPELKRRGKTVVAVTHDDKFWDCCDRRIELDLGTMKGAGKDAGSGAAPAGPVA